MENTAYSHVEEALCKHGTYAGNTVGVSMRPLFKTHRDVVVLKKTDRELKKYDVVLYIGKSGKYVLHRIIGQKDGVYVIRGDNTYIKEYVPKESVLAYLVSFNRKGKRHSVEEFGYKLYSKVWNFIYPIRFCVYKPFALLRKVKRKLFK